MSLVMGSHSVTCHQVTLCDPIWQVTLRSCVMAYVPLTAIHYLYLFICQTKVRTLDEIYSTYRLISSPAIYSTMVDMVVMAT